MAGRNIRSERSSTPKNMELSKGIDCDYKDGGETALSEEQAAVLMAVYPILYLSKQYRVGDILPAGDPEMVDAWLEAGTAAWMNKE